MKIYNPSDITDLLNIKESTLRKYCLLLEDVGITFQRNNRGQRWYSDNDVIMLRKFTTLRDNGDMTLKDCANAVFMWHRGNDATLSLTNAHDASEQYSADITELKKLMYKQNDLIEDLSGRLDQQQEYINKQVNERDKLLMNSLNEIMEGQKQIASEKENKVGIFTRLFRKGY